MTLCANFSENELTLSHCSRALDGGNELFERSSSYRKLNTFSIVVINYFRKKPTKDV